MQKYKKSKRGLTFSLESSLSRWFPVHIPGISAGKPDPDRPVCVREYRIPEKIRQKGKVTV